MAYGFNPSAWETEASGYLCVPGQPGYIVRVSGNQTNIKEKERCFISIPFGFSSDLLF